MSRSTKWKLAIVAGISECLVYAEAKFCAFEIHGEPKYYKCPRTEYCCNFGCCVSPGFQIYHLWYYWLLVIIMLLVCSGGGWWYRYWLQGRYRAAASAIPTRSSSSRIQNPLRGPTCQAQQARITYNTARNTVLLHRMWKGPYRSATSPAYSGAAAASSAAHYQNTSVVLNDANCPYYQLYGPPPSYETVIAQTRGKISSPSSPELLRPNDHQRAVVPLSPPPGDPNYPVGPGGQCYYNVPARLAPGLENGAPQYQPSGNPPRIETTFDSAEYVRIVQQQYGTSPASGPTSISASPRHQQQQQLLEAGARVIYDRSGAVDTGKSSDNSDGEKTIAHCSQANSPDEGGFSVTWIDRVGRSCTLDRPLQCYTPAGKFSSRIGVHGTARRERTKFDSPSSSQLELATEPIATTSSSLAFESCSSPSPSPSSSSHRALTSRPELRKIQGGSLKIPRKREQQQQQQVKHYDAIRASRRLSSTDYEPASCSRDNEIPRLDSQSNPSSNVILAANATCKSAVDGPVATGAATSALRRDLNEEQRYDHRHRHSQQQQHPAGSLIAERCSTNSNLESKRKLDRSRSLE